MRTLKNEKALVLFSGGQDSAACLMTALDTYGEVTTIGFDYGQRHKTELDVRKSFLSELTALFPDKSRHLGEDYVFDLTALARAGENALTTEKNIVTGEDGLPNTFVPGRNLMFFTQAAAFAYTRGIKYLIGGMCETDYSGYPDCRDDTLKALQVALNLGMQANFVIQTPLMRVNKPETWEMIDHWGGEKAVDLVVKQTHSCYKGERKILHIWGYGCGDCPACHLRAKGFEAFQKKLN